MFEECFEMYSVYKNSKIYDDSIGKYIEHFFEYVKNLAFKIVFQTLAL